MKKFLFAFSMAVLLSALFCSSGCRTTMVPVAVPAAVFMRPPPPVDETQAEEELKRLQKVTPPPYVIAPTDTLQLVVTGNEELGQTLAVMQDGRVIVAPVGSVHIAGLTLEEATKKIAQKLKKVIVDPEVTIIPREIMKPMFVIAGKVSSPGSYPVIFGYTRIADAIALAGGLATGTGTNGINVEYADLQNSYITRKGKILPVNFRKAVSEGNALHNIPIMNGDYIYIASAAMGNIIILGELGNTTIPYQPKITMLQALAMAGGQKITGSDEVKLIRGGMDRPVVYTINIAEIQSGKVRDFPLEPLDVIYNPRDGLGVIDYWSRKIMPAVQVINTLAGPFGNPSTYFYGK